MPDLINHSFEQMLEFVAAAVESDMKRPTGSGSPEAAPPPLVKSTRDCVRMVAVPKAPVEPNPAVAAHDEAPVRPRHRPAVPVLTVLDDGSFTTGQDIRIRTESFTIGRTHGDLLIPNDSMLSGRHAELRLTPHSSAPAWTLHDLGSSNRVFVRVQSAVLVPGTIVMLGTRRFEVRDGGDEDSDPGASAALGVTSQTPARPRFLGSNDILAELPGRPWQRRFPLTAQRMLIGRDASQCGIHVDDPTLARAHAELARRPDGLWQLRARPSKNGVWISTRMTRLATHCFFQCGEQRFRFMLP